MLNRCIKQNDYVVSAENGIFPFQDISREQFMLMSSSRKITTKLIEALLYGMFYSILHKVHSHLKVLPENYQ